jgi:hypothetical protein
MSKKPALSADLRPAKHRTTPIKESLTSVPGYPTKLTIYLLEASSYWWVRYYDKRKIFRRSTKETEKRKAIEFAKKFYDELNFKQQQGLMRSRVDNFEVCVRSVIEQQEFAVKRGDLSAEMAQADRYRLDKEVLPFFRDMSVKDIDYFTLERFQNKLVSDNLHASTISNYMGLVSKTLKFAQRRGFIVAVPQMPRLTRVDKPRGWFTINEYRLLRESARRMSNGVWEERKRKLEDGRTEYFFCERLLPTQAERAQARRDGNAPPALSNEQAEYILRVRDSQTIRRVPMSVEAYDLIVFMVNSFIRPTDLKWMKHKHVDVVNANRTYLRLRIPTSKKHNKPIVTMAQAVNIYQRIARRNAALGYAGPEDYLFAPEFEDDASKKTTQERLEQTIKNRDAALVQMQRQFGVVLAETGLKKGPNGEDRTLYALRHTCIMYRLLYGHGMDLLTLARNARTGTDMIERFYAADLEGEHNIDMLQSRRGTRKVETLGWSQVIAKIDEMPQDAVEKLLTDSLAKKKRGQTSPSASD